MEKTFDVIGVEDLIMDFALQIARIPKTDGMALIEDSCWAGGGNASSAIVALARLGARCAMVGTTGNDAYGAFCRADMEKNGVDVSHVKQVEGETTLCVCLAERETQGRSFLGRAGVAGEMTAEDVDEQLIANARVVHLSCSRCTGQEAAVKFAKKHGVEVSLDAALLTPATKELADQSDILIMSEQFYEGLFGNDESYQENCRKLVGQGTKIAVVTLGKKGLCRGGRDKDISHGGFLGGIPHRGYNRSGGCLSRRLPVCISVPLPERTVELRCGGLRPFCQRGILHQLHDTGGQAGHSESFHGGYFPERGRHPGRGYSPAEGDVQKRGFSVIQPRGEGA